MEGQLSPEELEAERIADEKAAEEQAQKTKDEEPEKAKKKEPKPKATEAPKEPETPKVSPVAYAELPANTMLAVKFEQEEIKEDELGAGLQTAKKTDVRYVTKSYWQNVEKGDDGVTPRYLRAKLLGVAIEKKDANGKIFYEGFIPFT